MPSDTKTIVKRVTNYGPKPRSVRQALIQAHAFLAEEGQWIRGNFFQDGDPKEAYEKAQCSSWSACAMGALGLVTGEMQVKVRKDWYWEDVRYEWEKAVRWGETELGYDAWAAEADYAEYEFEIDDTFDRKRKPLSAKAAVALARQLPGFDPDSYEGASLMEGDAIDTVVTFNDHGSNVGRTQVLRLFEKAIRAAGGEPLPTPKKATKAKIKTKRATK